MSREWRKCHIAITKADNTRVSIPCERKGALAVHRTLPGDGRNLYGVTHVPSGLLMCIVSKEEDAKRIVEYVLNNLRGPIDSPHKEFVVEALPARIVQWLIRCRKQHAWIDP